MKKTKIVVSALAVLLLSTAASVSGTVAWFSMNTSINVTGMTVTTKVSSNLQIATSNDDLLFSNDDLKQTRSGIIEPASTVNGDDFFYTTSANAIGDAKEDKYGTYDEAGGTALENTYANKQKYDALFNGQYGFNSPAVRADADSEDAVCYAYIDYSFYLKASIVGDAGQKIIMNDCNILYNDTALSTEWAWRVALFSHVVNANTNEDDATTTGTASNLVSILDLQKSKNLNEIESSVLPAGAIESGWYSDPQLQTAASGNADGTTRYYKAKSGESAPKAISGATAAPTAVQKANLAANVATGVTGAKVYKVVVRLWLEGEDVSCTSDTFASLTKSWTLSLSFALDTADGVQYMTSVNA